MKLIVILFVIGFSWAGFSQHLPTTSKKNIAEIPVGNAIKDTIATNVSDNLAYVDGANLKTISGMSVTKFISGNYNFTQVVLDNKVDGTIIIQFIVEKDGVISNVIIEQGLCKTCDEEAIRVVKKLRVNPVLINGIAERIRYRVPLRLVTE